MAFDLSKMLSDVSELDTGRDNRRQLEYIDIARIRPDPRNFYELSGIDELTANIELLGLQQPLLVRQHPEEESAVMIVSGHRRHAALERLINEGHEDLRLVPCLREDSPASEALQELRLIFANSDTRRMSPAEQAKQAERVEALLYELKEQGIEFPGRMRDHVAEACKMSKSKLARLKVIRERLNQPGLRRAFEEGRLSESTAYELARQNDAVQELADEMPEYFCSHSTEEAMTVIAGLEKEAAEDKAVSASMAANIQNLAAPVPKAEFNAREYLEQREEEDLEYRALLRELILSGHERLIPSNFGSRKDNIDGLKYSLRYAYSGCYELSYRGEQGKGLSVARRGKPFITRTWTEAYDALCGIALEFVRSARKDHPVSISDTIPEWQTGEPNMDGEYYCKLSLEGSDMKSNLVWRNGQWMMRTGHELDSTAQVLGWWPLPVE